MSITFKHDFAKTYTMVHPIDRRIIIDKIHNDEIMSECTTGRKNKWWSNKHHPDGEIPKNIYLLGEGNLQSLFEKYITQYGSIEWEDFINYTRELIKQQIMG